MKTLPIKEGRWFTCNLDGIPCVGRVQLEGGDYYLCQNLMEGIDCKNKLGFKYSWHICDGSNTSISTNSVSEIKFFNKKPSNVKIQRLRSKVFGYGVILVKGKGVKIGCTFIPKRLALKVLRDFKKETTKVAKSDQVSVVYFDDRSITVNAKYLYLNSERSTLKSLESLVKKI